MPVDIENRVLWIHDVERHRAVIHVHDDLYRVADVIATLCRTARQRLRVGVAIRDGIGVLNPIKFAVAHYSIRVLVEQQEWRDLRHAFLDTPPDLNSALWREIRGEQNIHVFLCPGKQEPLPNAVQRDSTAPLVARIDVLVALGIVKLLDSGRDDLVARRYLAIIDCRLGGVQASVLRYRGNIFNKILRKTSADSLRDEIHDQSIPMSELQIFVDPCLRLCRQLRG